MYATMISRKKKQRSKECVASALAADHDLDNAPEDKGMLHEAACSVLMQILYAARMGRPSLQRTTVGLSSYVTKWNSFKDTQLHRLICYIWCMLDYMQEGHIAERVVQSLECTACTDADFAGCVETQGTTSGGHLCLEGSKSHFVIHSMSKRQDSTASSTPEADMVAADTVLRTLLMPALEMFWGSTRKHTSQRNIEGRQ